MGRGRWGHFSLPPPVPLPLPLLPGSHSLPSPTKIQRLEPYQKANPNTLNTGLNFGVILPITCIHALTSQQLHQSFELESNSSLTRTMLLSTERKKVIENQFYFGYFLSQGSLLAIPLSVSFRMDGWGRTLVKRFIEFYHFFVKKVL